MEDLLWADDFVTFESRSSHFSKIMDALRDDNISMIGIYGMGGIGKSKLAAVVRKKAEEEGLFDAILMTVVSQTPNIRYSQGLLADMLDMKFLKTSEVDRAIELCAKLLEKKKVLIIVDDIWEEVNFEDIGIPSRVDHKGCKIIITTRRKQVCDDMCCQTEVFLDVLEGDEALRLFRKHARIEGKKGYDEKARKIVAECGGLPLALTIVGSGLKNKDLKDYENAFQKLSQGRFVNRESDDKEIYHIIRWSVDYLQCDKSKECFRLCSLYSEDHIIDLESFTRIVFGLGLFEDSNSVEEVRKNVLKCIKNLLDASLIQLSSLSKAADAWNSTLVKDYVDHESYFKMHDIVRDVASWMSDYKILEVSSSEKTQWKRSYEKATAISINESSLPLHPLRCPNLEVLLLKLKPCAGLQDNFFETVNSLRLLELSFTKQDLHNLRTSYNKEEYILPDSVQYLHNLRVLILEGCSQRMYRALSMIGSLVNLQILNFYGSNVEELPKEIGLLTHLRLLDLRGCRRLRKIPLNLLTCLIALEEFYAYTKRNGFIFEDDLVSELICLPLLTAFSGSVSWAPQLSPLSFRNKLQRYTIISSNIERGGRGLFHSRNLGFDILDCSVLKFQHRLFLQVEYLHIKSLKDTLEDLLSTVENACFESLFSLRIDACDLDCLIDTTRSCPPGPILSNLKWLDLSNLTEMRRLCKGPLPPGWMRNLTQIWLSNCPKFKNIVPHVIPMAQKLKRLRVFYCNELKHVYWFDLQDFRQCKNEMSLLPSVQELYLNGLPELTGIWGRHNQLEALDPTNIDNDDELFNLILMAMERSFDSLASIDMYNCGKITSIFTPASARNLPNLRSISILNCGALKAIITMDEDEFPKCANWSPNIITFPELETIHIESCGELRSILPMSVMAQGLPKLKRITIIECSKLEQVFGDGRETATLTEDITMNHLKTLELENLPSLRAFSASNCHFICPILRMLSVMQCPLLDTSSLYVLNELLHRKRQKSELLDKKENRWAIASIAAIEGLISLEFVVLEDLDGVEELFHFSGMKIGQNYQPLSSLLKQLILQSMPDLNHIWKAPDSSIELRHLEDIEITKCPNLATLFTSAIITGTLQNLRELVIMNCENLETIFGTDEKHSVEPSCLSKLRWLTIKECPRLKNVIPLSMAQHLSELTDITIEGCPKLEDVFYANEEQPREYGNMSEINLLKLQTLKLIKVPRPARFSSASHHINCPSLTDLTVKFINLRNGSLRSTDIGLMEAKGKIKKLKSYKFDDIIPLRTPNHLKNFFKLNVVNCEVEEIFDLENIASGPNQQPLLTELWHLYLDQLPDLKYIWKGPSSFIKLERLMYMNVSNCVGLSKSLFTHNIAHTLSSLETLYVKNCKELEHIIEPMENDVEVESVIHLPRLKSIWVEECEGLISIFPVRVTELPPRIEELYVKSASKLKTIFDGAEKLFCNPLSEEILGFPELRIVHLEKLPSLCPTIDALANGSFEWASSYLQIASKSLFDSDSDSDSDSY